MYNSGIRERHESEKGTNINTIVERGLKERNVG
jgi:hypothetical protein